MFQTEYSTDRRKDLTDSPRSPCIPLGPNCPITPYQTKKIFKRLNKDQVVHFSIHADYGRLSELLSMFRWFLSARP